MPALTPRKWRMRNRRMDPGAAQIAQLALCTRHKALDELHTFLRARGTHLATLRRRCAPGGAPSRAEGRGGAAAGAVLPIGGGCGWWWWRAAAKALCLSPAQHANGRWSGGGAGGRGGALAFIFGLTAGRLYPHGHNICLLAPTCWLCLPCVLALLCLRHKGGGYCQ